MARFIATRRTAEDTIIHLWPNGAITWALGRYVQGSPHPRTEEQREEALRAGWLVMGEVELYDDHEVPALIAAARWTAKRGGDPGMMRKRLHAPGVMRLVWTMFSADRDGKAIEEFARLPRLRWPGLVVFRKRGEYSLWSEIGRSGSFTPTGIEFTNLRDLTAHLESIGVDHTNAGAA